MLKEIIEDKVDSISASNQPFFRTDVDYDALVKERASAMQRWSALSKEERAVYTSQADFETRENVPDLKDPDLIPAKNLSLVKNEIKERLGASEALQLLSLDALDFEDSLLELAESLENIEDIRDIYRIRKLTVGEKKNSGINTEEASRIKNCFSQGRELFLAGRQGSLMVKPLNFFYALTAYSYGVIILNNPLRYRKDMLPGSHGMAYLPDTIQAQFGGDSARGTFSDLVTAFPTQIVKRTGIEFHIDCCDSLIEFYKNRYSVSLGTLLSIIPEMTEYYKLTTGKESRCHPLDITTANTPRSLTWEFHIGNGEHMPPLEGVERAFPGFSRTERHGKTIVTVPASSASQIKACIYTDLRGNLWYIDNPFFPIIIPEIAAHFLITSMFSNIMRYRPDEWGNVLLNDVPSAISLVTRHYFSSFQRKFLVTVLRATSRYLPYATFG